MRKHALLQGWAAVSIAFLLAGCSGATWPAEHFPDELEVKRTLFASGGGGFREACVAMVAELADDAPARLMPSRTRNGRLEFVPPLGWNSTPLVESADGRSYYRGAFGGCNNDGDIPLGDLPGALTRPGAIYKIINGGEGIAIIIPRAKLAGFFYFG